MLSGVHSMKAGRAESLVSLLELAAVSAGACVLLESFSCPVQARTASRWVLKPCFHPQARVHAKCGKSSGSDITWPSIGTAIFPASTSETVIWEAQYLTRFLMIYQRYVKASLMMYL
jgi:hypothetical protein